MAEKVEYLRTTHHKLYLDLVTRRRLLNNGDFVEIFPEAKYKADLWTDCLDESGLPKLNPKKFWTYVNESKAIKRLEKEKRKAEIQQKKKF